MFKNIYEKCLEQDVTIDNRGADLYILKNDVTKKLVLGYEYFKSVTTFTNKADGKVWYVIPFAYSPWWNAKQETVVGLK